MTALREAAQAALEALKSVQDHRPNDETNNAITALKAALAKPDPFQPDWDRIEPLQENLREHMAEIQRLRAALADGDRLSPTERVQDPVQEPQLKRIHPLDMPLEVFVEDLSTRPRNIINAEMGYFTHLGDEYIKPPLTVRHLLMFSRKELRKWPNLGKRSLNEIEEMLRNRGLQLWDEHDERSLRLLREHPTYFRAALAEPVQEPVASLMTNVQSGDVEVVWNDDGFDREMWHETPLYAAPPQRKPLTEEELDELSRTMVKGDRSVNWLCRAIERAHGIT